MKQNLQMKNQEHLRRYLVAALYTAEASIDLNQTDQFHEWNLESI